MRGDHKRNIMEPKILANLRRAQGDLHNAISVIDRLHVETPINDAKWQIELAYAYAEAARKSIELCLAR